MKGHFFNIDHGYLEGLCRGFKNGILKQADYLNLVQCETLEGKKKDGLSNILFSKENSSQSLNPIAQLLGATFLEVAPVNFELNFVLRALVKFNFVNL